MTLKGQVPYVTGCSTSPMLAKLWTLPPRALFMCTFMLCVWNFFGYFLYFCNIYIYIIFLGGYKHMREKVLLSNFQDLNVAIILFILYE